jgi:hypothetical protein
MLASRSVARSPAMGFTSQAGPPALSLNNTPFRNEWGRPREDLTPTWALVLLKGHSQLCREVCPDCTIPPPSTELIWVNNAKAGDCDGKAGRHQRGIQTAHSLFSVR